MNITNLAQFKKALSVTGTKFTVINHRRTKIIGQIREVGIVKGNHVFTKVFNDPTNEMSTCNGGKGTRVDFEPASHYDFNGEMVDWYAKPKGSEDNQLIMTFGNIESADMFDQENPNGHRTTFLDLLQRPGIELDCDLIIGDCDMPATFVWDGDCKITEYGIDKFKPIMEATYAVLDNGNIEIHCDDYKLGEYFCLTAAGYVSCSEYDRIFGTNSGNE